MHWGKGILIAICIFVGGIITMVVVSFKYTNELMEDNYYEKELLYQNIIDGENNLLRLGEGVEFNNGAETFTIKLPLGAIGNISGGNIEFLRPSGKQFDRTVKLAVDAEGTQVFNKSDFEPGYYKARISWKNEETPYYKSLPINIE